MRLPSCVGAPTTTDRVYRCLRLPRYTQVSQHAHNLEVNIGFFIAQNRSAPRRALELMLPWALDLEMHGCHDQKIFDYAITASRRLEKNCVRRSRGGTPPPTPGISRTWLN